MNVRTQQFVGEIVAAPFWVVNFARWNRIVSITQRG